MAHTYTLNPVDDPTIVHLGSWEGGPPFGRVAVELDEPVTLTDEWQQVIDTDGRTLQVRRADCGAGCRCAGEVKLLGRSLGELKRFPTQFDAERWADHLHAVHDGSFEVGFVNDGGDGYWIVDAAETAED